MVKQTKRIKLKKGFRIHNWKFIRDDGESSLRGCAYAVFECLLCKKEYKRGISCVTRGITESCKRCSRRKLIKTENQRSVRYKAQFGRYNLTNDEKEIMHGYYLEAYQRIGYRAGVMLTAAKTASKKKKLPITITKEWIVKKLENGICEVTNIPFVFETCGDRTRNKYTPSLDRKDPKQGYTVENTRVVIWMYNLWKSDYTDEDVLTFAKIIITSFDKK